VTEPLVIQRLQVRTLSTQSASVVSACHVLTEKITAIFPRLSQIEASLCSPNFRQSRHGRGILGASLRSQNFNFQNCESRDSVRTDQRLGSHCCDSNASVHTTASLNEMSCAVSERKPVHEFQVSGITMFAPTQPVSHSASGIFPGTRRAHPLSVRSGRCRRPFAHHSHRDPRLYRLNNRDFAVYDGNRAHHANSDFLRARDPRQTSAGVTLLLRHNLGPIKSSSFSHR
jgi:hypothetical protein